MKQPEEEKAKNRKPLMVTRRQLIKCGLALPLISASFFWPLGFLHAKTGKASPVPQRKPKAPRVLMIDPGHGGRDPGAIGQSGTMEKDVALDIALKIDGILKNNPNVDVKLTRNGDEYMSLKDRIKKGVDARADLFISVHADSAKNASARGMSAYTLSEKASDSFASELAEQENRVDEVGGVDLSQTDQEVAAILFDLSARYTRNTAQRAKVCLIKSMGQKWKLLENPMRSANFAVLRSPEVPSILIETGFLSNRQDEKILSQNAMRNKIAHLMASELEKILTGPLFG